MGLADISFSGLSSRAVRSKIGSSGVRTFDPNTSQSQTNKDGGIIKRIINAAAYFVGWLLGAALKILLGVAQFSWTVLWGMFVSAVQFVWTFDWNITDKSFRQLAEGKLLQLSGQVGGTLGGSLGHLFCGVLPGAVVFSFNEALGAKILKEVGEEAAEELVANLAALIQTTFRSATALLVTYVYMNARRFIKKAGSPFVQKLFGKKGENALKAWGEEGSKPWSFAGKFNEFIESIDNKYGQEAAEEGFEELIDACVEAGYVVAGTADAHIAAQALTQQAASFGQQRIIEITPNRQAESERIILAGPEKLVRPAIVSTLAQHQMIANRDIGDWVGMPVEEHLRRRPMSITVEIKMCSRNFPPTQGAKFTELTIPDINPAKCEWAKIKLACGGTNGYLWGRFYVTGQLSNGGQSRVYGSSHDEAEDRMRALLALSKVTLIKKPSRGEDREEDASGSFIKQPTRVYPFHFTILNQYQVPGGTGSSIPIQGSNYKRKNSPKILLWPSTEPFDADERIREALRKPGAEEDNL